MDPQSTVRVLAEIAETASETLELQDVFSRVAASIRRLIPLDNMGVVRILEGRWAIVHASTVDCAAADSPCSGPTPLSDWSLRSDPSAI